MPLYSYECLDCKAITEKVRKMSQRKRMIKCPGCNGFAKQVIVKGHGGIQCDSAVDVPWLLSAEDVIKPEHLAPWETRKDYLDYLESSGSVAAG